VAAGGSPKKGLAVEDRELWDPVMLEEYLAGIELGVDGDQVLELRRRVLGRTLPMLIPGDDHHLD
jgi:hypothetical protein